jgi:hypothetical protein
VHLPVKGKQRSEVAFGWLVSANRCVQLLKPEDVRLVNYVSGQAGGRRFQHEAKFINLEEIARRELANERSAPGDDRKQRVGLQSREGLTHWGTT